MQLARATQGLRAGEDSNHERTACLVKACRWSQGRDQLHCAACGGKNSSSRWSLSAHHSSTRCLPGLAPIAWVTMLRAATGRPELHAVDGIGAYDNVLWSATLGRLHAMPEARSLLPFFVGGSQRLVTQAEGGEPRGPIHAALVLRGDPGCVEEVATALLAGNCAHSWTLYDPSSVCAVGINQSRSGIELENMAYLRPQLLREDGTTHRHAHDQGTWASDGRSSHLGSSVCLGFLVIIVSSHIF